MLARAAAAEVQPPARQDIGTGRRERAAPPTDTDTDTDTDTAIGTAHRHATRTAPHLSTRLSVVLQHRRAHLSSVRPPDPRDPHPAAPQWSAAPPHSTPVPSSTMAPVSFWSAPSTYIRWASREKPAIFWSLVIGSVGPVVALTVPPIRARFGDGPRPQIPLTYPIPKGPRAFPKGYED
ncbi:hypothetical protein MBLNU459_g4286t1 [Dothideomycetes sp. NU459]